MPNRADENGRYEAIEIPHAPISRVADCQCAFCTRPPEPKTRNLTNEEAEEFLTGFGRCPHCGKLL